LTSKDGSDETISKNVVDWLNQVGGLISAISGIAAALAAIFGLFFPNLGEDAQRITLGMAGVLAIGSGAVYLYQRRRAAKLKIAESLEPLSATAALRGLLPFEEGDQLPGRARDVQELYTLVASSSFRFGVLWGESGCGKTSLMRAGLVPKLRNEKFLPIYINKPTNNPQEAVRSALLKETSSSEKQTIKALKQLLESAAPKGKKIVVLFDQFEEFFLTNRTPKSRAGFVKWLGEIISDESVPVVFLIGIRSDFFAQLQNFAPQIPEPTSIRTTFQLQNFDAELAKQIFSAAAKADGIPFEPELIQAVIRELETEEFIRPAELQVVGTRLKRKNIIRLNQYEALGGSRGILSSYISDEIKQSPNDQTARLVLRLMCADIVETKSQTDLSLEDILHGISGTEQSGDAKVSGHPEEIQVILNQFVSARVLIHTDEDKYNLAHDYLAPYVRTATEGAETNTERANRLLKRYVAEYKDDHKTRIPFGRTHWIQIYASAEVKAGNKAQELIRKSKRDHYAVISVPILLIASLYLFLASSYYFSIANSYVVLRAGYPSLKFLPGFDQVMIQTDFKESDLDPKVREKYLREQDTGFWLAGAKGGYRAWGEQLVGGLSIDSQARALSWMGQSKRAEGVLINTINDPRVNVASLAKAAFGIGLIARDNPQIITPEMLQTLNKFIGEPPCCVNQQLDWESMYRLGDAIAGLAQANPQAVRPEIIQTRLEILKNPEKSDLHWFAAEELGSIILANPQLITPEIVKSIVIILTNREIDPTLRGNLSNDFGRIVQSRPQTITPEILKPLIVTLTNTREDPYLRTNLASALGEFVQVNHRAFTPDIIQSMIIVLTDPQEDPSLRDSLSFTVSSIFNANPQAISPELIQDFVTILADRQADFSVRSSAALLLGHVNSPSLTSGNIQMLVNIVADSKENSEVRSSVVRALGQLSQATPEIVTPHLLQTMLKILTDPQVASKVRSSAASTLESLATAQPRIVSSDLLQSLWGVVTNPETNADLRSSALYTFASIAKSNREYVTTAMIQSLVVIITDPQEEFNLRLQAASTLGELAQQNPKIVTPEVIQSSVNLFIDPQLESYRRPDAAHTLETLARVNPQAVTSDTISRQMDILNDSGADSSPRSYAAQTLGLLAQSDPQAITPELIQTLIVLLKTDTDAPVRSDVAYALIGIAFGDKDRENEIRRELADMQTATQPHWRIAASRILEMLEISNSAVEEARAHPDRIEKIMARLNSLTYGSPSIVSGPTQDEPLEFAVLIARQEIEKIGAEAKK
jgi:HEAT repeat protein